MSGASTEAQLLPRGVVKKANNLPEQLDFYNQIRDEGGMKGDVVIVGRPVGIVSQWVKKPRPPRAAVPLEQELAYEPEVDLDELRAREEACWEGCDES